MSSEEIEKITESTEPEITETDESTESTGPEITDYSEKSIKEIAREKLKEKLDAGFDLADKNEKSRICHEIANEIQNIKGSCSYQAVSSEVKYVLKAKKKEESNGSNETKQVGGHSIVKKGIRTLKRPARTTEETTQETTEETTENSSDFERQLAILKKFEQQGESAEEMMINFTLQDVSFLIQALGLPKPQTKRLQQRARQIAMWNEMQRAKGNPENVISISDNVLKPLMFLGIVTTFAEPIVRKYFPPNDSKSKKTSKEIETVHNKLE